MRASRLLQILLMLQNRGRMTAARLAHELEVSHRTILRDMEALSIAGLPILTFQGNQGGFELGFSYRTRLTGLLPEEAEALAVLVSDPSPRLSELGLADAARRASSKLLESLPDQVRAHTAEALLRFVVDVPAAAPGSDRRVAALADAVRHRNLVRLRARSSAPLTVKPVGLHYGVGGWSLNCADIPAPIPAVEWHDINIAAQRF